MKAGKIRAIVAGTAKRVPQLPDVQTFAEAGVKDTEWAGTFGIVAPAKTPKDKTDELAKWIKKALQSPDLKDKFSKLGLMPEGQCGADYGAFLRKQYESFGKTIAEAHIKVD